MPKETLCHEQALKDLFAPEEILVDQNTARRLEELCSEMTDTCGHIEATLQLAVEDETEKRAAYIKTALYLSARGTRAIKMFLSEWSVLVQDSKIRENRPSAKGSTVAKADLANTNERAQLPQIKQSAVTNALRDTGGDKAAASRLLGIARTTLYRKLKEYNQSSKLGILEKGDNR